MKTKLVLTATILSFILLVSLSTSAVNAAPPNASPQVKDFASKLQAKIEAARARAAAVSGAGRFDEIKSQIQAGYVPFNGFMDFWRDDVYINNVDQSFNPVSWDINVSSAFGGPATDWGWGPGIWKTEAFNIRIYGTIRDAWNVYNTFPPVNLLDMWRTGLVNGTNVLMFVSYDPVLVESYYYEPTTGTFTISTEEGDYDGYFMYVIFLHPPTRGYYNWFLTKPTITADPLILGKTMKITMSPFEPDYRFDAVISGHLVNNSYWWSMLGASNNFEYPQLTMVNYYPWTNYELFMATQPPFWSYGSEWFYQSFGGDYPVFGSNSYYELTTRPQYATWNVLYVGPGWTPSPSKDIYLGYVCMEAPMWTVERMGAQFEGGIPADIYVWYTTDLYGMYVAPYPTPSALSWDLFYQIIEFDFPWVD